MYLTYRNDVPGRVPPFKSWLMSLNISDIPSGYNPPVWGVLMPLGGMSVILGSDKGVVNEEARKTMLREYYLKPGFTFVIKNKQHKKINQPNLCHILKYSRRDISPVSVTYCTREIIRGVTTGVVPEKFNVCLQCQYEYWRINGKSKK